MNAPLIISDLEQNAVNLNRRQPEYYVTADLKLIKQFIWLYFLLLILEGALRKWVFPGLAMPLLIVRDPVALVIILLSWKNNLLPSNIYLGSMVFIGIAGMLLSVVGHGNILVALYGARILLLHFPLLFIIGRVFDRKDVLKLGKMILWISIPMMILVVLQFYGPQSSWVNRGIGDDAEGGGFSGALGYFRPPGTFSFTNGNTLFYSLTGCFIFFFWLQPKNINRLLLILATIALVVTIPVSISRGLFFQTAITFVFVLIAMLYKPKYVNRIILGCIGLVVLLIILNQTAFFQKMTEVFLSRFESANEVEGGVKGVILDRYFGGLFGALAESSKYPFFGYGIGMGTNVGSILLTGNQTFLISEGEWGRLIGELGLLLGLSVILIRLGLVIKMAVACYRKLCLGDPLPWLLLSFGFMTILQAQWSQPTSLGFSTLIGGLILASLKNNKF